MTGGESGKVHSTVKDRWAQQEPELVEGMRTLGELADAARECLQKGDAVGLAQLMEREYS
jgi:glucuronokinase